MPGGGKICLFKGREMWHNSREVMKMRYVGKVYRPPSEAGGCPARHSRSRAHTPGRAHISRACGFALSLTAISGLGSVELWREHAVETARAFSAMNPEYIGLLTLMVEPGTPLEKWVRQGAFTVLDPIEVLKETELFLETIHSPGSVFRMNHASNYLSLRGTLDGDIPAMLAQVRRGLEGQGLKPEFLRAL